MICISLNDCNDFRAVLSTKSNINVYKSTVKYITNYTSIVRVMKIMKLMKYKY